MYVLWLGKTNETRYRLKGSARNPVTSAKTWPTDQCQQTLQLFTAHQCGVHSPSLDLRVLLPSGKNLECKERVIVSFSEPHSNAGSIGIDVFDQQDLNVLFFNIFLIDGNRVRPQQNRNLAMTRISQSGLRPTLT